jgi:hypothetical protein
MPVHGRKEPKKRFMLPFATPSTSRFKDFTKNMERAAVLYLAESNRKKGESSLLKKTDEKLVFITEAYYPVWIATCNTTTLMFDGFGISSHTLSLDDTPDTEVFSRDIRRNQKTTEAYTATLTRNIDYFKNAQGTQETKIEGLITAPDLKEAFKNYLPHMKEIRKPLAAKVLLKPAIKSCEIQAGITQLSNLRKKIDRDIENMDASMKLLNTTTTRRVKAIRNEIKKSRQKHYRKTKETKLKSTRRLLQIQSQYNQKITRTSRKFKKKLLQLNKNQVKLKKTQRNLRKEAKRCETKFQSCRRHNRKRSERHWFLKLERTKKKLPALHKRIEENAKQIRHVENAQKLELAKQRIKCCKHIEAANKKLLDLQGSREAETIMKRQEIATLEDITRYITKSMQEIVQNKKLFNAELDTVAMSRGKSSLRLVYMPFYLVRFEKEDKKRYALYPPSVIGDMGVLTKMKGALGAAKMKALLQPRSEAITTFLNQLPTLFEKKPMLEKYVTEAGIRRSILLRKQLRASVMKGLKELESENWISKGEHQTFSKILYMYASAIKRGTNLKLIRENNHLKFLPAQIAHAN